MSTDVKKEIEVPSSYDDIRWKDAKILRDKQLLESNRALMRNLFALGMPTKVIDYIGAENMPQHYEVDGVIVQFLPHWGFYRVGNYNFPQAESQKQILEDVQRVKEFEEYLESRGGGVSKQ